LSIDFLSPTKNVVHSPSIDSVYSYYLNFNNDIYVLNNWSYIQEQEIQNINNQNIFDCNKLIQIIDEEVFLIRYEVKNIGHTLINLLFQINFYVNNFNCKILILKDTLEISNFIKSIVQLSFDNDKIIIIETNHTYNIKKLNLTFCNFVDVNVGNDHDNTELCDIKISDPITLIEYEKNYFKYRSNLEDFLIRKIKYKIIKTISEMKCDKICIIKSYDNVNATSIHRDNNYSLQRSFNHKYIQFFENSGFTILDPSKYTCEELYIIFNNASFP